MPRTSLSRKLDRLEEQMLQRRQSSSPLISRMAEDPAQLMVAAGMPPDPWQARVLCSAASRMLLLCSRQSGKSRVAAALALHTALCRPRSPILLLSPSQRQSGELFRKVVELYEGVGRPLPAVAHSALRLELANGSRIVSLPGDEKTVRCFSGVVLLVIDEAARVLDSLYYAVRPMLAVAQGRLVALSTPFGKRGWFHDAWHGPEEWERVRVTAEECPRITPEFLAEERRVLGERYFRQEYMTDFTECVEALFSYQDIQAALSDEVQPLFRTQR